MEEIKVGEYVRTIDGYIRKIEQVNKKGSYDGLCHGAYNVDIPYKYSQGISAKKIKSHSPNIIDLIEEGDYVNGKRVVYIDTIEDGDGNKKLCVFVEETQDCIEQNEIKSIITKEQIKQIEYIVKE